jgi:hypothetical protein
MGDIMKWLLLTVLLTFPQTLFPVPRQAADSSTRTRNNVENQSRNDHKPPASSSSQIISKEQSPPTDTHGKEQGDKNAQQSVRITELPTVSVKDNGIDWRLWVFNGLLVVVGLLQVWLLFGTLKVTKTAADAAKASADAVVNGERAWLLMDSHGPILQRPQDGFYQSPVTLKNFGKTPAKVIAINIAIQIESSRESPSDTTVYDGETHAVVPDMIPQGIPMPYMACSDAPVSPEQVDQIRDEKRFLWLCGSVRYEDIFRQDPIHETRFCYLREDRHDGMGMFWYEAGPPEYNHAT